MAVMRVYTLVKTLTETPKGSMPSSTRLLLSSRAPPSIRSPSPALYRAYANSARPSKRLPYSSRSSQRPEEENIPELPWFRQYRDTLGARAYRVWTGLRSYGIITWALWSINSFLLWHFCTSYIISFNGCYGPSMLPTLNVDGDGVLISKLHSGGRWVKIGDLVSFDHPVRQGTHAIKRIVGMPGDFVLKYTPEMSDTMVMVPENHVWVAGDNLPWTRDSRHYGPLPMGLIRGRVVARLLPWKQMRWFGNGLESRGQDD